jgi:branched-subunit amino acid ABC-type transport system permease component
MEAAFGRKRVFLSALLNGITLGGLYFLVASGFTLIFGLMRNVNLAHGSLYLLGGYLGWSVGLATGSWTAALIAAFLVRWMARAETRPVAVALGAIILEEPITVRRLVAAAIIIGAVALMVSGRPRDADDEPEPADVVTEPEAAQAR